MFSEFAPNASVDKLIHYSSEDILYVEVKTEGILNDDQVMQAAYYEIPY